MSFLDEIFHADKEINNVVIIDFSNILYSTYFTQVKFDKDLADNESKFSMWRYLILNQIMYVRNKLQPDELVLAVDYGSWRGDYFKYYKAARKLKRQQSEDIDYKEFFEMSNQFISEIGETFPYKIIKERSAEADDVITILVKELSLQGKNVTIVSRDKDFKQLLISENIKFYDPQDKCFKTVNDPYEFLEEHIIKGDRSDGVPNLLSDDNVFVNSDIRQKRITKKVLKEIAEKGLEQYVIDNNLIDNYERNKKLIELSRDTIPEDIWTNVLYKYNQDPVRGNFIKVTQFFRKYRIRSLVDKVDSFI
jgi:hypothetical protein